MKTILILVLLLLTNRFAQAQEGKLLRLNLPQGSQYEISLGSNSIIKFTMKDQPFNMDMAMSFVTLLKVDDVLPNKNLKITYSYKSMKISMNLMGKNINLDSDNPGTDTTFKPIAGLLKARLKVELTPLGKVVSVEGLDEFKNLAAKSPAFSQVMNMFSSEEAFKSNFSQTFGYFPEAAVKKGDSWKSSIKMPTLMNMSMDMTYTVNNLSDQTINLGIKGDINMNSPIEQMGMKINALITGTQNGSITIDANNGMVGHSELTQDLMAHMKVKNPQSDEQIEIPMNISSKININSIKI